MAEKPELVNDTHLSSSYKIPDSLYQFMQQVEDLKLISYQDPAKVWTVGVGHTGPEVKPGMVITHEQAKNYLQQDLQTSIDCIVEYVLPDLNENQFHALISFVFNIGVGAFINSGVLTQLNLKNFPAALARLKQWNKATVGGKKVILKGLQNRRQKEIDLFLTPSNKMIHLDDYGDLITEGENPKV